MDKSIQKIKKVLDGENIPEETKDKIIKVCSDEFVVIDKIKEQARMYRELMRRQKEIRQKQSEGGKKGKKDPEKMRQNALKRWGN
jgi:RNA polymerase-interacting CarD/CdnL/TRCF family regulator